MRVILILYLPAIHKGYLKFLEPYQSHPIYLLGQELVDELAEHREIRALDPEEATRGITAMLQNVSDVKVLDRKALGCLQKEGISIIAPDEAIMHALVEKYFPEHRVTFERTFLRWESGNVFSVSNVLFDRVSTESFDRRRMNEAEADGERSSDWWRRAGAVLLTSQGLIFRAHNEHVPSEYAPYINGDPRDSIKAGTRSEISSALHAEKGVLAQALRHGVSTLDARLYVTIFPCPDCAKLIAFSGVGQLFFRAGHASLDGFDILKAKGIEIVKVE